MENVLPNYRLKEIRQESGETQADLAKLFDVRQEQYSRWERNPNTMSIDKYIILAQHWNLSLDYICGLTPIRKTLTDSQQQIVANRAKVILVKCKKRQKVLYPRLPRCKPGRPIK